MINKVEHKNNFFFRVERSEEGRDERLFFFPQRIRIQKKQLKKNPINVYNHGNRNVYYIKK